MNDTKEKYWFRKMCSIKKQIDNIIYRNHTKSVTVKEVQVTCLCSILYGIRSIILQLILTNFAVTHYCKKIIVKSAENMQCVYKLK